MDIKGLIKGLHHVTATVAGAQEDYDFYVKTLGLRLVKETVNFDNESVYHFYYGNEIGSPSTIMTTFPYAGQGVRKGAIGSGQVSQTSFSIPMGTLTFWKERLKAQGVSYSTEQRFDQEILVFEDPSGLKLDIMEAVDERTPVWSTADISKENAIRGIHNVTLLISDIKTTIGFLELFGYEVKKQEGDLTLLEAGDGGAGNTLIVKDGKTAHQGVNGIGTVHHVAHRVASLADSLRIRDFLVNNLGIMATDVKDRKYFESIYFRIPGGVLFEIATEDLLVS